MSVDEYQSQVDHSYQTTYLMSKNVLPRSKLRRNIDIPSRPLLNKLRHRPKSTPRARMIRLRLISHSSLERARNSLREINPRLIEKRPTGVGSVKFGTVTICTGSDVVEDRTHCMHPREVRCKTT